jgi:uncharacterized protein (DUF983 family)
MPELAGDIANLVCNECGAILRTVPAAAADETLSQMASGEITSATCPHCGMLNMFQGFSSMLAFTCRHCGEGVKVEHPQQ